MKTTFSIIILLSLLNMSVLADELDYQGGEIVSKTISKDKKTNYQPLSIAETYNLGHIKIFLDDSGEKKENLDKFIQIAVKDKDWQDGNFYFGRSSTKINIKKNNNTKSVFIPEYDKALESFYQSVRKTGNVLSAYQGMCILEDNFMIVGANTFTQKYMRTFAEVLTRQNYCKGFLYNARTYEGKFGTNDPNKTIRILGTNEETCTSGNGYNFYRRYILEDKAKASYIQKLREKR